MVFFSSDGMSPVLSAQTKLHVHEYLLDYLPTGFINNVTTLGEDVIGHLVDTGVALIPPWPSTRSESGDL